jgi:hypothetical protein
VEEDENIFSPLAATILFEKVADIKTVSEEDVVTGTT